ncbi:MAG TPA: 50S ribosomal protein L4 [Saprospiraceae bacterium]|nr:50S ribosomal protein L4 [Saprospiraceae bacterium]
MKLDVLNINGEPTGRSIELPDNIFGIKPNEHVLYLAVKAYRANQRQGTHKAKEKSEVSASTRKIKKQKGTGTARAGSIKSPLFKGGGRVFGPKPRDYSQKLNKKVKKLAKASALSAKAQKEAIVVVEDFTFDKPKTKEFINILKNFKTEDKKTTLILNDYDSNVYLSSRNLKKASVVHAKDLNVYEILNSNTLLFSEGAVGRLVETFSSEDK